MATFLTDVANFLWGAPLLFVLLGPGIFLCASSFLLPLKGIGKAFSLLHSRQVSSELQFGQLRHVQVLCNALAATVGLGNIAGVAVALSVGGAGALFWMWIAAFVGMVTKFYECSLAVKYRKRNARGQLQGGAMYVLEQKWGKKAKPLAVLFAGCGLVGTLSLFQINQLSSFMELHFQLSPVALGAVVAATVFIILWGGLQRMTRVLSLLVPFMGLFYVILCLGILLSHNELLPSLFATIFSEALGLDSAVGGWSGTVVQQALSQGVRRATFSNEAGLGTAPLAHGDVDTKDPVSDGLVAMLGPFLDTIVICTMTGLVVLLAKSHLQTGLDGIGIASSAFMGFLPEYGLYFFAFGLSLFSFSTILGMANYNSKCWDYFFQNKKNSYQMFVGFYTLSIIFGAWIEMKTVLSLMDVCYGLMAFPNIAIVVRYHKEITHDLHAYLQKGRS